MYMFMCLSSGWYYRKIERIYDEVNYANILVNAGEVIAFGDDVEYFEKMIGCKVFEYRE